MGELLGFSVPAVSSENHCCETRTTRQGPKLRIDDVYRDWFEEARGAGVGWSVFAPPLYRTEQPKSSSSLCLDRFGWDDSISAL